MCATHASRVPLRATTDPGSHPLITTDTARIRLRRRLRLPIKTPRGWGVGPPDFVGVGAQRSGTSWWFRQVTSHPEIAAPWGKERHYFESFWQREMTEADARRYQRLFPRPSGTLTGEWTPRYMYDQWTPQLLKACAPEAKILMILRDPWERFLSGIAHESRVLERELRRSNGNYLRLMARGDALRRSLYTQQLLGVLASFDRSQVLILQYERCVLEPEAELERTFRFLGVDVPTAVAIERRAGAGARREHELPAIVADGMRSTLADDVERLVQIAPEIEPELWPTCW
jgi:sulfotransferase family protein